MENIEIKRVAPHEIDTLQKIGRQTFSETFSGTNSPEDMAQYLEEGFSIEKLSTELSQPTSMFYFALSEGQVIGYLKLNTGRSQTELQDEKALEIERIYLLSAFHGKKAGQLLFNKALQIAEELHSSYLWLGVWENNQRAIRFYEKNGFVPFGKHLFKLGKDEQTDIMMKKIL